MTRRARRFRCAAAAGLALVLAGCSGEPAGPGRLGEPEAPFQPFRHELGPFVVELSGRGWDDARLRAFHRPGGARVFETLPGRAFLEIARGRATLEGDGARLHASDEVQERCTDQTVDRVEVELYVLRISGRLRCRVLDRAYELFVVPEGRDQLRFHVRLEDPSFNRIVLTHARDRDERIFGLGARERFELGGRELANLVTLPRRGAPGWRDRLRLPGTSPPAAGSRAPAPHWLTSAGRAFWLENSEPARFDLSREGAVRVEVHASELTWRAVAAATPAARVRALAAAGGTLRLPAWIHSGPILAAGGGGPAIREVVATLAGEGLVPAALYVRDAAPGDALDPVDRGRYPRWDELQAELARSGIHVLLAASPVVRDAEGDSPPQAPAAPTTAASPVMRDAEGDSPPQAPAAPTTAASHVVRSETGVPFAAPGGGVLADLSLPAGRVRLADLLAARRIAPGAAGLVVHGGALLPFDARLADGSEGAASHNRYATQLAATAARAFADAAPDAQGVVLADASYVGGTGQGALFGAGAVGEPATLARLLSAGVSGFPVAWVSLGAAEGPPPSAAALGLAGFMPVIVVAAEALDTPEGRSGVVRAARIHAAWAGYRAELVRQARESGLPILRPPWLHHPEVPAFQGAQPSSFLVGSELLVVPNPEGAASLETTLPPGRWIDLFSGDAYGDPDSPARRQRALSPEGLPAVLFPEGSIVGVRLARRLAVLRSE